MTGQADITAFSGGTLSWTRCHFGGIPSKLHDPPQTRNHPTSPHHRTHYQISGWPSQTRKGPGRLRGWPRWKKTQDPDRGEATADIIQRRHRLSRGLAATVRHPCNMPWSEVGSESTLPRTAEYLGIRVQTGCLQLPLRQLRGKVCVQIWERMKGMQMGQKVNNWWIWVRNIRGALCTVTATSTYVWNYIKIKITLYGVPQGY